MTMFLQHAATLAVVLACVAFLARRGIKSLLGGKCASGCGGCNSAHKKSDTQKPQTVFIPVETLTRKKKSGASA